MAGAVDRSSCEAEVRSRIRLNGVLADNTSLDGEPLAFIVAYAVTDSQGHNHEYWIATLRGVDPALARGEAAVLDRIDRTGQGRADGVVAICYDIDFAVDTYLGQFRGRGPMSAMVPEAYER